MDIEDTALVYIGRGAGPFCQKEMMASLQECSPTPLKVKPVTCRELAEGKVLDSAVLLAMPGGRDLPYHEDLSGLANSHIRQWVEQGGCYLGICAGAYYGATEITFELGTPLEITGTRELRFFPTTAYGPLYGLGRFEYGSEAGAEAAFMDILGSRLHVYYNGGCAFKTPQNHHKTIEILGRHMDLPKEAPVSVIGCHVGQGRALLSGVHIEYRPQSLVGKGLCERKLTQLQAHDDLRKQVFQNTLKWLLT